MRNWKIIYDICLCLASDIPTLEKSVGFKNIASLNTSISLSPHHHHFFSKSDNTYIYPFNFFFLYSEKSFMWSNKNVSLQYIKPFNGFSLFLEWRQHTSMPKIACFGTHLTPQIHLHYTVPNCSYSGFLSAPQILHVFSQHIILCVLSPLPDYAFLSVPQFTRFHCFVWNHNYGAFPHIFYESIDLLQIFITLFLFFIAY